MQDTLCFQNYGRNNFNYMLKAFLKWKMDAVWPCKYIHPWPNWKLLFTQAGPHFFPVFSFPFLSLSSSFPLLTCSRQISVHDCAEKQEGFWLIQERGCRGFVTVFWEGVLMVIIFDRVFFIAVQESVALWLWLSIKTLIYVTKRDITGCSDAL